MSDSTDDTADKTSDHSLYDSVSGCTKINSGGSESIVASELARESSSSPEPVCHEADDERKSFDAFAPEKGDGITDADEKYKRIRMRTTIQRKHARTAFLDTGGGPVDTTASTLAQPTMSPVKTTTEDPPDAVPCIRPIDLEDHLTIEPSHVRSYSLQSVSTADSCAVTTHSPECFRGLPQESIHVRNTPVRRTSSLNAEVNAVLERGTYINTQLILINHKGSPLQSVAPTRDILNGDNMESLPPLPPSAGTPYSPKLTYRPNSPAATIYFPSSEYIIQEPLPELSIDTARWTLPPSIDDTSDDERFFSTPLHSPKKQAHGSDAISLHRTSYTEVPHIQEIDPEFVAARLPLFGSSQQAGDHLSISSIDGHRETTPKPLEDYEVPPQLASTAIDSTARSVSSSSTGSSRVREPRERSWKMRQLTVNGEESTCNSLDTPSRTLQTSSLKKGVWWRREGEATAEIQSPLARMTENLQSIEKGLNFDVIHGHVNMESPHGTGPIRRLKIYTGSANENPSASAPLYEASNARVTSLHRPSRKALEAELKAACDKFEEAEAESESDSTKANQLAPKMVEFLPTPAQDTEY